MRIKFITYAMPGHVPGEVADLPDDEARDYIAGNAAVPVAEPTKLETTSAPTPPVETTSVNVVPEAKATPAAKPVKPAAPSQAIPVVIDVNKPNA